MKSPKTNDCLTADFCHPVKSSDSYYSTACVMYAHSSYQDGSFILGNSIYVPIVKLTSQKIANGVLPTDKLTAQEVEKYVGEVPSELKITTIALSGSKYIESVNFGQYSSEDALSQEDVNLTFPVKPNPTTNDSKLKDSLVIEIKTKDILTNTVDLNIVINVVNRCGYKSTIYINFDVVSNQQVVSQPLGGNIKRYTNSYDYINAYYNYLSDFQITPTLTLSIGEQKVEMSQFLWEYYFSFKLKGIQRDLSVYKKSDKEAPGDLAPKITIYDYIHQIPDSGIKYDSTFNQLYAGISQRIGNLQNPQDKQQVLSNLSQIDSFLKDISKQSGANLKLIKKFASTNETDSQFLTDFYAFLKQYCNFLLQVSNVFFSGNKQEFLDTIAPIYSEIIEVAYKFQLISESTYTTLSNLKNQLVGILYDILNNNKADFETNLYNAVRYLMDSNKVDPILEGIVLAFIPLISDDLLNAIEKSDLAAELNKIARIPGQVYSDVEPCLQSYNNAKQYSEHSIAGVITFDDLWTKTIAAIDSTAKESTNLIAKIEQNDFDNVNAPLQQLKSLWDALVNSYFKGICLD
jgi:hypothetical protein